MHHCVHNLILLINIENSLKLECNDAFNDGDAAAAAAAAFNRVVEICFHHEAGVGIRKPFYTLNSTLGLCVSGKTSEAHHV